MAERLSAWHIGPPARPRRWVQADPGSRAGTGRLPLGPCPGRHCKPCLPRTGSERG